MAISRRFLWTPAETENGMGEFAITMPFDPKEVFGKARAPVIVTIGGHSYRSTIANMGGPPFVPFRMSNREAAGAEVGKEMEVVLTLDEEVRTVDLPDDLLAALEAIPGAMEAWDKLSFTNKREQAEAVTGAKKAETRVRRLEKAVEFVRTRIKGG